MASTDSLTRERGSLNRARARCTNRRDVLLVGRPVDKHDKTPNSYRVSVAGSTLRCCEGCAVRTAWAAQALIRAGLQTARQGSYTWFLTITEVDPRDFAEHSVSVGRFLEDLWLLIAKTKGVPPKAGKREYFGVREVQTKRLIKHGEIAWHTHLLIKDVPKVDFEAVRLLLERHGLGSMFKVKTFLMRGDGQGQVAQDLASYLSKSLGGYLTKMAGLRESWESTVTLLPKGKRLLVSSHGWADGMSLTSMRAARIAELKRQSFITMYGREPGDVAAYDLVAVVAAALAEQGLLVFDDHGSGAQPDHRPALF